MKMFPVLLLSIVIPTAGRLAAQDTHSPKRLGQTLHEQTKEAKLIETEIYRDNSFGAYSQALKEGKYTAILFTAGELDPFSPRLLAKIHDPKLSKYADRLRFSYANEDRDKGAKQLVEALGVIRYPTLVILKTNSENIHVAGRIEGEVTVAEVDRVFRIATEKPIKKP